MPTPPNSERRAGWGHWTGAQGSCTVFIWPSPGGAGWRLWAFLPQLWGPQWTELACSAPPLIRRGCWKRPVLWACVGLGAVSAMWPPGEGVNGAEPPPRPSTPVLRQYSGVHTPIHLQACIHRTKDSHAGRFTHSGHEFLETVILNLKHRLLLYTSTMYCYTHTDTDSRAHTGVHLPIRAHTHPVFGEYLPSTTRTQDYSYLSESEIHLLTGLHLDTHQLTIYENCLHVHRAPRNPGTLREAWPPCVP